MSVIVSLTSTSNRLHLCRATLYSLTSQSFTPDKIIINLSHEPYLSDEGITDKNILTKLIDKIPLHLAKIIECRWVENTGPYRKLIPILQSCNESDIIITADDDIFYGKDWLKSLLDNFNPADKTIHAARVRVKTKNVLGRPAGYSHWPIVKDEKVLKKDWVITYGGGAVLYRGWFSDELINDRSYLEIAPTADDLWYSKICELSGLYVKTIPLALSQLHFFIHDKGLFSNNATRITGLMSKIQYHLIDHQLNYFMLKRFGNDKSYQAIQSYFEKIEHHGENV